MITNVALIEGALRDLNVVGETQAASPEQGAIGLEKLNQLMTSLAAEDIQLGYFPQTVTALTNACPIPAWAERGVRSWLSLALVSTYPTGTVSPLLADDERNGVAIIRRICTLQKLRPLDYSLLGAGQGRFDITTGTVI